MRRCVSFVSFRSRLLVLFDTQETLLDRYSSTCNIVIVINYSALQTAERGLRLLIDEEVDIMAEAIDLSQVLWHEISASMKVAR